MNKEEFDQKYVTVTAIINTHNVPSGKVPLIRRAMKSVLGQSFDQPWEVIVINDGPASDDIVKVMEEYEPLFDEKGVRFMFTATDESSGYQCYPKNRAIWYAKGEYIAFLDYDNVWMPEHLQMLYDAIVEGDVWPDFTYARRRYINDTTSPTITTGEDKEITLPEGDSPFVKFTDANLSALWSSPMGNFVDTSDFMASRGMFWRLQVETGWMWNEGYRRFGDWELIARATGLVGCRGKAVDAVLTEYHWHGDNVQLTRPVNETPGKKAI